MTLSNVMKWGRPMLTWVVVGPKKEIYVWRVGPWEKKRVILIIYDCSSAGFLLWLK